jgi:hypothetical protein
MAFSDWVFEQTGGTPEAALTGTSPLADSSSLRLSFGTNGTNRGQAAYLVDSAVPLGMSKGKIRTLIRKISGVDFEEFCAGIFCLAEATTFGSDSVDAYMAVMDTENEGVRLLYANITEGTSGVLVTVTGLGFTNGVTKALEFEWNNDQVGIGGVHLIVRIGDMTDFSDLTEVINYVDPVNPTVAGYEGICHINDLTTFAAAEWYFDNTSIFELS